LLKGAMRRKLPYVGESADRGIYRVVFAPVEDEFYGPDAVEDAVRHSAWGEDREFGDYKIKKVRSTVPPEEYPYVCACGERVSKTTEGRCENCDEVQWTERPPSQPDWEAYALCPTCGEKSKMTCRCPRSDSMCPNGHHWHLCTVHKKVDLGKSDHCTDTFTCTCPGGK